MDIVGPMPKSSAGSLHNLTFVDYGTRWVEAYPMKKKDADTVARLYVEKIICRFGAPRKLLSDLGKQFTAKILKKVNEIVGTEKIFTTAYHPQTNGLVEPFHRILTDMLSILQQIRRIGMYTYLLPLGHTILLWILLSFSSMVVTLIDCCRMRFKSQIRRRQCMSTGFG